MDIYAVVYAVLIGAMAVGLANSSALQGDNARRERYLRDGVLRPGDTPRTDAPEGFIAREAARDRRALLGSVVLVVAAIALLFVVEVPTVQTMAFVILLAAFLGRAVVVAVLAAREAYTAGARGPRVSRGGVQGIAERLLFWPYAALAVAQLVFLGLYLPQSLRLREDLAGWVTGIAVVSLVALVGGWALAWWVARQPQLAATVDELAWSDASRRRDLGTLLMVGPLVAFGVSISAFAYGGGGSVGEAVGSLSVLAVGYALIVLGIAVAGWAARRNRPAEVMA